MSIMVNNVDVVKEAAAQMTGIDFTLSDGQTVAGKQIAALDSFEVTDVGRSVVGANGELVKATTETFFNSLMSVVARIEVDNRAYSGDMPSLMVKNPEWGWMIERIKFEPADIIADPKWNLMNNYNAGIKNYAEQEHGFYPLKARARIYDEGVPIMTPVSFPTDQLREAVRNESEMQAIVSGMRAALNRTVTTGVNSIKHMLIQDAIAVSCAGINTSVPLLTLWQATGGSDTVTAANWQQNPEFIRFCLQVIAETRDNMADMSANFNNGTIPTFTAGENSHLILLNKFDKAARFALRSNTYHDDLLGIGKFDTVTSWQGFNAGDGARNYDFGSVSKIMIAADANNKLGIGTAAYTKSNVIGFMFDRYALGICPYKRKVTSQYTAIGDYFNEFHHTLTGTLLDSDYNMVAFVLE